MSEDNPTAIDHLTQLLNRKDAEIHELSRKVEELENQLEGVRGGWMVHETLPKEQTLPVPRLELIYEPADPKWGWGEYTVVYQLVYRHLLDHHVGIPLGRTKISGGSRISEPPLRNGKPDLPFRDGAHIQNEMRNMDLPGFAILQGKVWRLVLLDRGCDLMEWHP